MVSKYPHLLDAKSKSGLTPLLVAAKAGNVDVAKLLTEMGSDVLARDNVGRNMLHLMFRNVAPNKLERFKAIVSLIPKKDLQMLFTQRVSDNSPLATIWWQQLESDVHLPTFKYLLFVSEGAGLDVLNGDGNLPLHKVGIQFHTFVTIG